MSDLPAVRHERALTGVNSELAPRSVEDLISLSSYLAKAHICPKDLRDKPADVALVLMWGFDLGLSAPVALTTIRPIYGRPSLDASLLRALVQQDPLCEEFEIVSADDKHATIRCRKRGWSEPRELRFDIEDAVRAGLVKKDSGWDKWPEDMCVARATSRAQRRWFPWVALGMVTSEEARELPPPEKNVTPQQTTAERIVAEAELEPEDETGNEQPAEEDHGDTADRYVGTARAESVWEMAQNKGIEPEIWAKAVKALFGVDHAAEVPIERYSELRALVSRILNKRAEAGAK